MPAWATVAITVGVAIISAAAAIVASYLTGKQGRALQLRDRAIEAAGAFSISAHKAIAEIKDAVRSAPTHGHPSKDEVLDSLHKRLHEAEAHALLASLLFEATPDAERPSDVIRLLREAVLEVRALYEEVPEVKDPSVEGVKAKAEQADDKLQRSLEAVLKALKE